ncbi:kelch-like protein 12 [Saccostrea cucullata]|uniref:kelch-like protein 12 n=1 Tax=Saccostrea cuccullata TaxID=36930 RepID=UPI002ED5D2A1
MEESLDFLSIQDDGTEDNIFQQQGLESVVYQNDSHSASFLREMYSLYEEQMLIDITLKVEGQTILCHRNVLAATSVYFKAMFTMGLNETMKDVVELNEVEYETVRDLVEYAYTGHLKITQDAVQSLLSTSSLFQILPVVKACAKFLESQLDDSNCIGIYHFAQSHDCKGLAIKAKEHLEKTFPEVCKSEEFLSLPLDKVKSIIQSNDLNVDSEEVIFNAIISWITADPERHADIAELFPLVRLSLLSSDFLCDQVYQNAFINSCPECQSIVESWRIFEKYPNRYLGRYNFDMTMRAGMIRPDNCLVLIGGSDPKLTRPKINCYNPITKETFLMQDFPVDRQDKEYEVENVGCIVSKDNVIFVGGGNYIYHDLDFEFIDSDDSCDDLEERIVSKDFFCFDNDHNRWIKLSPMLFPKSNFTLAELSGKIYCFGGVTENQHPTEIIEVYDIQHNKWSYQGMLPTTVVDLASVTYNEYIFLLGGRTGVGAHNLVVMYHPEKGHWITRAGIPTPRFNFGACVVDDEIYVAGGQIYSHVTHSISREALKSVEILNVSQNQWRSGPDLPAGMFNVGLELISGALYACGTAEYVLSDSTQFYRQNIVCRLDFGTLKWQQIDVVGYSRNFKCLAAKLHTRKLKQVFPTNDKEDSEEN